MRSYSVCVNNKYYYDFVALLNSYKYYNSKYPLKVYVVGELDKDRLNSIKKHCQVYIIEKGNMDDGNFIGKALFKYIALLSYMSEYEIVLDSDMLFLSNIDYLFNFIEQGYLIGANEGVGRFAHRAYYATQEEHITKNAMIKEALSNHIGDVSERYSLDLTHTTLNGGLLGLNKTLHSFLLQKTIDILSQNYRFYENPTFHNEQYMINLLIKLYDIRIHELNNLEWMNTWTFHKNPKKIIKIEDGKFAVYNENGPKINMYHFTGGIGMTINENDSTEYTCRPHQLYESVVGEIPFTRKHVEELWYQKHENPLLLLYEYFTAKGI